MPVCLDFLLEGKQRSNQMWVCIQIVCQSLRDRFLLENGGVDSFVGNIVSLRGHRSLDLIGYCENSSVGATNLAGQRLVVNQWTSVKRTYAEEVVPTEQPDRGGKRGILSRVPKRRLRWPESQKSAREDRVLVVKSLTVIQPSVMSERS